MCPDQYQQPHTPSVQNRRATRLRLLLPILVVICAAAVAVWMMQSGPKANPRAKIRNAAIVDVRPVEFGRQTTHVSAMGTVIPQREVILKPQVSGGIIQISDKLIPGGHFARGEQLLTIDPRDYQLEVQQLASEVARVEADRQLELGRQMVAQKEYELLGEMVSAEEKALMLRQPQLENLRAVLDGTRARLEQAQIDLERTVIKAPFNAVIMSREINIGTIVSPGTTLATLVGSDRYWIEAPIPASQLQWIKTSQDGIAAGSEVRIFDIATWGTDRFRNGQVIGLTAAVEEQGRMAKLLVEVRDPLALQASTKGQPVLLLGSYVRVEIAGANVPNAAAIERNLVRDGNRVWIMDDQGTLDIRSVDIAFRGQDQVLITGGIRDGELLVTSNLPAPVQGMSLRLKGTETTNPAEAEKVEP
ncbi:MAG: efflux RND transporter periplasmic adaptor subunit [Desulfuromonadales bacterium]